MSEGLGFLSERYLNGMCKEHLWFRGPAKVPIADECACERKRIFRFQGASSGVPREYGQGRFKV